MFHERGRRTQEAVWKYFEDVIEKLYLHSDGAPIYKCYDMGELIVRIACLERQIRRIAKCRNNSFFVGSPAAGVRFARLMSVFANI